MQTQGVLLNTNINRQTQGVLPNTNSKLMMIKLSNFAVQTQGVLLITLIPFSAFPCS